MEKKKYIVKQGFVIRYPQENRNAPTYGPGHIFEWTDEQAKPYLNVPPPEGFFDGVKNANIEDTDFKQKLINDYIKEGKGTGVEEYKNEEN